ncbi:MAG: hypothetical protein QME70_01335 [Bacillota bacterium]|nr:hypothetical protein [Bacillota bacterium]
MEKTLSEMNLQVPITMIPVADAATAERVGFLGSPTVRVDGLDVDAAFRTMAGWSLACRVYPGPLGPQGSPPGSMVRKALSEAAGRQLKL